MWVLSRTDQGGGFVAKPGAPHSYTSALRQAQKYQTREAAEAAACDNERPIQLGANGGCGAPTYVTGTNGGLMRCGSMLTEMDGTTAPHYCGACQQSGGGVGGVWVTTRLVKGVDSVG